MNWTTSSKKGIFRSKNQDAFIAISRMIEKKQYAIFCVADGMGSTEYGELASQYIIKEVENWFYQNLLDIVKQRVNEILMRKTLYVLLQNINVNIIKQLKQKDISAGTTASILLLTPYHYFFVHCGDSRIYKVKQQKVIQITQDHTAVNLMKKMGKHYKGKKYNDNVLYSCIGIIENPEIQTGTGMLYQNDGFILVSDGVYRFTCLENIGLIDANKLTDYALQNKSNDNVTAITVTLSSKQNKFYQKWFSYFKW